MLKTSSTTGRKARAPRWWVRMVSYFPKFSASYLRPQKWTPELANKWIESIPDKCPFERQLWYKDTLLLYIPPLCPFNPLSEQLYSIKLEAKTYLYDLEKKFKEKDSG